MKREKALEVLNELPKEFDIDELIERMIFVDKVEKGLEQEKEGKTLSHEKIKSAVKKWRK